MTTEAPSSTPDTGADAAANTLSASNSNSNSTSTHTTPAICRKKSEDLDNEWHKVTDSDAPEVIPATNPNPTVAGNSTDTNTNPVNTNSTHTETNTGTDVNMDEGALQIVSIGTETDEYAFTFHKEALEGIMQKIPDDHKVCVVSVVGAFRTGKSFLLSWFLRYLNHHFDTVPDADANANLDAKDDDGNGNDNDNEDDNDNDPSEQTQYWHEAEDATLGKDGFSWRGGAERNTTGIWMWNQPYFIPSTSTSTSKNEKIALLLVDTQGMFDHETTMGLTAAIFGLSTLLSSYQIYNVDKRIQEDNLQQLALFSEYGRMALHSDKDNVKNVDVDEDDKEAPTTESNKSKSKPPAPFQKIEFLVRDWQNFDDDEDIPGCEAEMKNYLQTVFAERQASDLKDTREQILSCFEEVGCYLLTHPGFAVTKKKYEGCVKVVDPTFKSFMDRYCQRVFGVGRQTSDEIGDDDQSRHNLIPKSIHGRELTASELSAYIQNYAKMFESGAHFPEASTMLEATASANNSNATSLAIRKYKDSMDHIVGARCSDYVAPTEVEAVHRAMFAECLEVFDGIATFGSLKGIEDARAEVVKVVNESFEMYTKLNDGRNPLLGFETYILPLVIGFVSMISRTVLDWTCTSWSQTCSVGSEVLSHVYQVVFFFLCIVAATKAKQISVAAGRLKQALDVLMDSGSAGTKVKAKAD